MGAFWSQNTAKAASTSLALRTIMLPQVGSSMVFCKLSSLAPPLRSQLRCRNTAAKARFVRKALNQGLLGDKYLSLMGQGADAVALDVMTLDALYALGRQVAFDPSAIFDEKTSHTLNALLSCHDLARADVAAQYKLLVDCDLLSLEQLQAYMDEGQGKDNALFDLLLRHISTITSPPSGDNHNEINLAVEVARSAATPLSEACDVTYAWDFAEGLLPIKIDYPTERDNQSVLKRDLINSVLAATQRIVMDFVTPFDIVSGGLCFDDSEIIEQHFGNRLPSLEEIITYLKTFGDDVDDLCENLPGFFHAYAESGELHSRQCDLDTVIAEWADNLHSLLHLRKLSPQKPLPEHFYAGINNDAEAVTDGELVAYLQERLSDALPHWPDSDRAFLDTMQEWVNWLNQRVVNQLPPLTPDYLDCARDEIEYSDSVPLSQLLYAHPGCSPELEYSMMNCTYQDFMNMGGYSVTAVIPHDRPEKMRQFLDGMATIKMLISYLNRISNI